MTWEVVGVRSAYWQGAFVAAGTFIVVGLFAIIRDWNFNDWVMSAFICIATGGSFAAAQLRRNRRRQSVPAGSAGEE